ncbi:uncharacterized protein LOC135081740 [Ostrinia nubilalis]|uniref:uncharacterized protein LOC135081740 n=1 Tax=Ostrinia nubilalis TaxID=29057 RepID=UPI003082678B
MNSFLDREMELGDTDHLLDKMLCDYDDTVMSLPAFEAEPHLLISKVRKHYFEYVIKLLSVNYEQNQKLLNKNIYLPSAIWRCAKSIEMNAAQTCMVVQLYRKSIVAVIKELKSDTKNGKLHRKLFEYLRTPPGNDKKTQTEPINVNDCMCQCACNSQKKRRKVPMSPVGNHIDKLNNGTAAEYQNTNQPVYTIPVIENLHVDSPQMAKEKNLISDQTLQTQGMPVMLTKPNMLSMNQSTRMSIESQDSDDLMQQMEKLFQGDSQEDDIFEGGLCDAYETIVHEDGAKKSTEPNSASIPESVIENHAAQIKSLDERVSSLVGLLVNTNDNNIPQEKPEENPKIKKRNSSKWICEEYFLKLKLYELLDEIGDKNRKKLARIKEMFTELFGDDSDDEGIMSPLEETPEFVISCKERIAPWVIKLLTPFYIKGRIRGRALFKAVAKHLIRLIYQCSKYPHEYEVHSFVSDFLENHKMIRCEADFKQFRIDNL